MIHLVELDLIDLKDEIIEDFKDTIDNIESDFNTTKPFNPVCYTWIEDEVILGYICSIFRTDMVYCSYTKVNNRKIYKMMYKKFKDIYEDATALNIPVLTDGTNFMHCANHVTPYKDTILFQWKL